MMLAEYLYSVVDGLRDVSVSEPLPSVSLSFASWVSVVYQFMSMLLCGAQ